ncbi:MAG: hypothetical protein KDK36_05670 [Leptospiraceae bacterium]|nr:hypothetical protein [Leptospiraceae bacterium]
MVSKVKKFNRNIQLVFILLIINCLSPDRVVPPPTDYSEIIEEIKKEEKKTKEPEKKKLLTKARETIQNQSQYSYECYERLNNIEERLAKLEKENLKLKEENDKLKEDLWKYQKIEIGFWILVVIIILSVLWKFLSPFLLPIFKRAVGIPI